jgi:hypothetical protein
MRASCTFCLIVPWAQWAERHCKGALIVLLSCVASRWVQLSWLAEPCLGAPPASQEGCELFPWVSCEGQQLPCQGMYGHLWRSWEAEVILSSGSMGRL